MTLKEWQVAIVSPDPEAILSDWAEAEREAKAQLEEAGEEIEDLKGSIDELKERVKAGPEWGNCRRGCPPAYLNTQGYCSPECETGQKDIEHYRRQNREIR